MRRLFLGSLLVAALAASGSAFAVEAGSAPGIGNPPSKQAASTKSRKRPVPLSEALGSTPASELPVGSAHTPAPSSAQPSWTGVYVGGGAGMSR